MKRNNINIVFIFTLMLLLSACDGGKFISKKKHTKNTYTPSQLANLTSSQAVMGIQKKQPAFTRAQVKKMSVSANAFGRQMDVKATCKIVTDSAMHISIMPFFGVEVFKLEMTPKSLIVIDKAHRRFYESNYGIFYEKFGVNINYHTIQSLISNRLFIPGNKVFSPDEFKWKNDTSRNVLVTKFDQLEEEVTVDFELERIVEMLFKTLEDSVSMQVSYANFKTFDDYLFPETIQMVLLTKKRKSVLDFKIEEVIFNKNFTMKNANLLRYTRTDIRSFFRK